MLITFEGLNGSGKTTVWEVLRESVNTDDVTFTREPTDSWYGDAVNSSIEDDDSDPIAELFLSTADHADHISRVVRPALERGDLVISDRYSDSRYSYQAASLEGHVPRPMEYIVGVHKPWTVPPDATIYLDVDPETGAARSGATNKFEQAGYLAAVQANYERLMKAEPERFYRVDATRSPEEVLESVEEAIEHIAGREL